MLLNLHIARFERNVMCKIIKQDKSIIRRPGDDMILTLAELKDNDYVRTIKSCDAPEFKSSTKTLFVRGTQSQKDTQAISFTTFSPSVSDAVCEDMTRLWAIANGVSPENIKVVRTDTLGSPYERELNETSDPDIEGVIIYTYEEVLQ